MAKSSVYTRTGDTGMTSLVDGSRRRKNSAAIEAYGTVDELNSFIGSLIASDPLEATDRTVLTAIQRVLFDIGGYLAAGSAEMARRLLPDLSDDLSALETEIDRLDETLPRHNKFILPQGTPSCAAANVARAVCRRAERRLLDAADALTATTDSPVTSSATAAKSPDTANPEAYTLDPQVIKYVNRLSDYLFVLSRHCNHIASIPETFWPGV